MLGPRSTCQLNEVPGEEHVYRTASPGHVTLLLDTREASFLVEKITAHLYTVSKATLKIYNFIMCKIVGSDFYITPKFSHS